MFCRSGNCLIEEKKSKNSFTRKRRKEKKKEIKKKGKTGSKGILFTLQPQFFSKKERNRLQWMEKEMKTKILPMSVYRHKLAKVLTQITKSTSMLSWSIWSLNLFKLSTHSNCQKIVVSCIPWQNICILFMTSNEWTKEPETLIWNKFGFLTMFNTCWSDHYDILIHTNSQTRTLVLALPGYKFPFPNWPNALFFLVQERNELIEIFLANTAKNTVQTCKSFQKHA